ncbi:diguanylate cyclase domain-containing protein [Pontibacterium sp.]|uniref:diguanylate cyclase domain-containing protein n=1 Tax=Pontibacterium sp. TaxID=2036026 RepID=UPI003518F8C3
MARQVQGNSLNIYILGFVFIFGAFIFVFEYGYQRFFTLQNAFAQAMHNNYIQQNAAMDMRVAVRERAILLWQMTLLDDLFKRNELYQRSNQHSSDFLSARTLLLGTNLTPQELDVIDRLNRETNSRAPELRAFAKKLMTSNHGSTAMLNMALSDQIIVANLLDELIEMQRAQNERFREYSSDAQTKLFSRVLLYMVIIVVAGFVFAGYVIFTSAKQRRQLETANTELQHFATHDHLTSLPNRVYLTHQIERVMSSVQRKNSVAAVLFIDLDNFKPVNDQYGHEVGDRCLKLLAHRIKDNVRGSDMAGRLGGDEFVVVLSELDEASQAEVVAQKLIDRLSESVWIDDKELRLSASIGVSLITQSTKSAEGALTAADKAMYIAKQTGKNKLYAFDTQ